jgi:hypothetical protein
MLGRFQELGLKVAFTDVNAAAQPAEPKPSYFAVHDALVAPLRWAFEPGKQIHQKLPPMLSTVTSPTR